MAQHPPSLYRSPQGKQEVLRMYQEKLRTLTGQLAQEQVPTSVGTTNILIAGDRSKPPVVVLHGITANAAIALEPLMGLTGEFCFYGIDIVGQPNYSSETRLPIHDTSYGRWLVEVLDGLSLPPCPIIGISYGAFVFQKLMEYAPDRIAKAILVVPAGLSGGNPIKSIFHVLIPMMRYQRHRKEKDLLRFMQAFFTETEPFWIAYQKAALEHVIMDTRTPPLLKKSQVANLTAPVYVIGAEDDVFFSGPQAIARARQIFPNFQEGVILEQSRHIPSTEQYPQLARIIGDYLGRP